MLGRERRVLFITVGDLTTFFTFRCGKSNKIEDVRACLVNRVLTDVILRFLKMKKGSSIAH
jgi:hypothetical protein